jgi:Domain of unknown function (DUF4129)
MKRARPLSTSRVILLCCFLYLSASADTTLSVSDYRQQLHIMAEQIQSLNNNPEHAGAVIRAIPDQVTVNTGTSTVTVNYHPLKDDLAEYSRTEIKLQPQRLREITNYVARLEEDAAAYDKLSPEASDAQSTIHDILSRREFKNVHGPGMKETLLARFYRWLDRVFDRVHIGRTGAFSLFQFLLYALVAIALIVLVFWTMNRLRRKREEAPAREIVPFSPSARSWRAWLAEARQHADRQDWRRAIHLTYWAAISFLEAGGAWKPNRARTPREYLGLLTRRHPGYAPLSTLTRKFEVVWYGDRPALRQDFEELLGCLEKLGCR